jgi:hypothetical protein
VVNVEVSGVLSLFIGLATKPIQVFGHVRFLFKFAFLQLNTRLILSLFCMLGEILVDFLTLTGAGVGFVIGTALPIARQRGQDFFPAMENQLWMHVAQKV